MYVNKEELETLTAMEEKIDEAWNIIGDCIPKSIIIGHDLRGEFKSFAYDLQTLSKKAAKLRSAYEENLNK